MTEKLYTVNEFAKLCDTSKSTLLVYDRKGLLKPAVIGENGYRYYKTDQYYDFYVIKTFQMAGSSLKEILECMNIHDKKALIPFLEAKQSELTKRQFELANMQKFIEKAIQQSEILDSDNGKIHTRYFSEEYLISIPADYSNTQKTEAENFLDCYTHLNDYIQERGYSNSILFEGNYIISHESFLKKDYRYSYHCYKIKFHTKDSYLRIKPAGTYAFKYISGCMSDFIEQCEIFESELKNLGYKSSGDYFVTHLSIGLFSFSESESIRLLSVKISE